MGLHPQHSPTWVGLYCTIQVGQPLMTRCLQTPPPVHRALSHMYACHAKLEHPPPPELVEPPSPKDTSLTTQTRPPSIIQWSISCTPPLTPTLTQAHYLTFPQPSDTHTQCQSTHTQPPLSPQHPPAHSPPPP